MPGRLSAGLSVPELSVFLLSIPTGILSGRSCILTHTGKFSADSLDLSFPEPEKVPRTAWWVLVRGEKVALRPGPNPAVAVLMSPAGDSISLQGRLYLGRRGNIPCYAGILGEGEAAPENRQLVQVRDLSVMIPHEELAIAAFAVRMAGFDRTTQICSRCGEKTRPAAGERARVCPSCGQVSYPRVSPAVIVLVRKGDQVLLARSPRFPPGMYGLIAGFVEPAENLEHAIRREVLEETGIRVKNIQYFGSEPWPFPDSLMIGFVADYAGGELTIDHHEIESAFWFDREHLPRIPERLSISRALIDWWIAQGQ